MKNPNPGPGRRFGPGNPGRPKGSRNKLGEHFFKTLHDDFLQHGEEVIERVRKNDPSTYLKIVSGLMPKELEVKRPVEELSDDKLAHLLDVARSRQAPLNPRLSARAFAPRTRRLCTRELQLHRRFTLQT